MQYIALIRKEDGTSYGVDFPDLPGLVSGGETLEDAMRNANEALALHLEGLAEDGDDIPAPSPLDEIMKDKENRGAVAVLVTAPIQKGKAVRVNLTFDEHLLARIDQAAAVEGLGRSGWVAMIARQRLDETIGGVQVTRIKNHPHKFAGGSHVVTEGFTAGQGVEMVVVKGSILGQGIKMVKGTKSFLSRDSKTGEVVMRVGRGPKLVSAVGLGQTRKTVRKFKCKK